MTTCGCRGYTKQIDVKLFKNFFYNFCSNMTVIIAE